MNEAPKGKIAAEVTGVLALASTALMAISLYTYNAKDPSFNSYLSAGGEVANAAGIVGAWLSDLLVQSVGAEAWGFPLFLLGGGVALVRGGANLWRTALNLVGIVVALVAGAGLIHLYFEADPLFGVPVAGGVVGSLVADKLTVPWLAPVGATITLAALGLAALLMVTRISLGSLAETGFRWSTIFGRKSAEIAIIAGGATAGMVKNIRLPMPHFRGAVDEADDDLFLHPRDEDELDPFDQGPFDYPTVDEEEEIALTQPKRRFSLGKKKGVEPLPVEVEAEFDDIDAGPEFDEAPFTPFALDDEEDEVNLPTPRIVDPLEESSLTLPAGRALDDGNGKKRPPTKTKKKEKSKAEEFQREIFAPSDEDAYAFPSLKLLDSNSGPVVKQHNDDLIKASRVLERKLKDFGIDGRVTQVNPGPVITIFEYEPAPGVKVSKIVSLADDLAMGLRALSVRIIAPIPGKAVVGIEVPNATRESVFLRDILESEEFSGSEAALPLALGKDVSGRPVVVDLMKVPHLLIAGSTGSGKSVGINAMISSILFQCSPSDVKFIMIDPKMLELSIYDGIPHLIAPVVTHAKKAANALKWVVGEMERRYALLAELGVRNITGYNRLAEKNRKELIRKGIDPSTIVNHDIDDEGNEIKRPMRETVVEKLPYIVVVIDELADLMMVASKEVEESLARLAQMARASGIHLIVATQRPSVDVLTGLIKANFPARASFQVRSRIDSRTILDSMGAEKLLGRGDMLYLPPGASGMERIQGPFVSDDEIHRVVNFLKEQSAPEYNEEILKGGDDANVEGASEDDMDEFYDQAVELVARTRQASISMIQRKLRIGYNRAARIVEVMEQQGLVGPSDGAKPREVYVRGQEATETTYNV